MNQDVSKKIFGRKSWDMLHSLGLCFNDDSYIDNDNINRFLNAFSDIFPCDKCKYHFKIYITKNPFRGNSPYELRQYFCRFHNDVNSRLNKPIYNCKLIN